MLEAERRPPEDDEARTALSAVQEATHTAYLRADAAALRYQRRHRIVVDIVAVSGTLAVVLGTVTLTQPTGFAIVRLAEAVAAVAALVAVILGLWIGSQRRWLLERHKAEQLRLAGFRALLRYAAGTDRDVTAWAASLREDVARVERLSIDELDRWLTQETPVDPEIDRSEVRSRAAVGAVVAEARAAIEAQRSYFAARAHANERWDARTRAVIPLLFFVSVAAIVPGALLRLARAEEAASVFISIAIIAPALAAGVRLIRSANEFARNGIRFAAKAFVLGTLVQRLEREAEPERLLRDLRDAEHLFEAEHREWLQLMADAEWYG